MKPFLIYLLCMIFTICVFGQDQRHHLVDEVEVIPPKFTGINQLQATSNGDLNEFLANNLQYPEIIHNIHIEGTEVVQFVITTTGEVTDFKVINSVSPQMDAEVIRVLKSTNGMWAPGVNNGEAVAMEREVSVAFKLGYIKDYAVKKDFKKIAQVYFKKGSKRLFDQKIKSALKCYDRGINYMPNDQNLLLFRGLCLYELGHKNDAYRDWTRARALGGIDHSGYLSEQMSSLKGYNEMMSMLNE